MIGVEGVADVDVEGPVGAQQQVARRLLDPRRRRHLVLSQREMVEGGVTRKGRGGIRGSGLGL